MTTSHERVQSARRFEGKVVASTGSARGIGKMEFPRLRCCCCTEKVDTKSAGVSHFKHGRGQIIERGVPPDMAVEALDVFEEFSPCLLKIGQIDMIGPFALKRPEKRLGDRIVEAVALAAHALDEPMPSYGLTEAKRAVLDAPIPSGS